MKALVCALISVWAVNCDAPLIVDAIDYFHSSHPNGDRKLAEAAKTARHGDGLVPPMLRADDLPVGKWRVEFANGVVEVCEIREDGSASVVEPLRNSAGRTVATGRSLVIVFEDDRIERWTRVGKRHVVEHWFPGLQMAHAAPVLGIADRVP
jgi:hypothetical protein